MAESGEEQMSDDDLIQMKVFLLDLQFIQTNALVAAGLQNDKKAQAYMKRIADLRTTIDAVRKENIK